MERSKAISPEITQIFESVKAQVSEYNKTFELVQKETESVANLRRSIKLSNEESIKTYNRFQVELKNILKSSLDLVSKETNKVTILIDDLNDITSLRSHLKQLKLEFETVISTTKNRNKDLDLHISKFNTQSSQKLESTLQTIREKVEKTLENESELIETRLARQSTKIENKVISLDKQLRQLNDLIFSDIKTLKYELDGLKSSTHVGDDSYSDTYTNLIDQINLIASQASANKTSIETLSTTTQPQDSFDSSYKDEVALVQENVRSESKKFSSEISELDTRMLLIERSTKKWNSMIEAADKKSMVSIVLSSIALVGIILLLFINILK